MRQYKVQIPLLCCLLASITSGSRAHSQDGFAYSRPHHIERSVQHKNTDNKRPLLDVLKELNKAKGVYFLYAEQQMGETLVNRVDDTQQKVERILQQVLRNTGLRFQKVNDRTFVILAEKEQQKQGAGNEMNTTTPVQLNLKEMLSVGRPSEKISGTVTNAAGEPMSGVSVSVKGKGNGTSTDNSGRFTLDADMGDVLVLSFVGYTTKEFMVDGKELTIVLQMADQQMNEVVVTALGIRKEAKRLGYATTKVNGEEFTKAREINVGNALVGKVAGVNSAGPLTGPGGSSRVTIRGNTSLTGDNQPLYLVNGIPMNNDNLGSAGKWGGADLGDGLSSINPDDIEEMTVLKGGAAAALYGQRGRNGVILITTKSGGAKGKKTLGIELNSNLMIDRINDFTTFQNSYGQGTQGNKPTSQVNALNTGLQSWGSRLDGSNAILFDGLEHPYSPQSGNMKAFYKTGTTFTNTVAISGGGENGTFRLSFGDLRNTSVYPNSKYNRNNVNLDLNYKLSEKWSGQANIMYAKEAGKNRANLSDAPGNGNYAILFLPPNVKAEYLAPGYDANGNEIQYNESAFNTNPYFAANRFQNNTGKDRLLGVASLKYNPTNWMYVQGRIANDFFAFNATQITPTGTAYRPAGSLDNESTNIFNETNADVLIGINKDLGKDFSLGITAGANLLRMKGKNTAVNANGLAFPYLYNPSAAVTRNANVSTPRKEVHSLYGSVELGYKGILFLNITDRNDWSSTLPPGKNSYNYPSVNGAWVFSEQVGAPWLSFGKLRAGYAMVGGDAPVYATMLYYNTNGSINGNPIGRTGSTPEAQHEIPNNQLEPLKVTELEIGAELKLFRNRLFADVSWYNKQTLNDIVKGTVSVTSGYTSAIVNVGKIENKGIEVLLGGTVVSTASFKWISSLNYAHNKSRIIRLAEGQDFMSIGESRTERGFIQHRLNRPFAQVMVYEIKRDAKGEMILGPTGLPQATDTLVSKGTGVHPVTGGWSNEFSFKQFSLGFLIDYKFGGVIYSGTNARAYGNGLHEETLNGREGGLTVKGVNDAGAPVTNTIGAQEYYAALSNISALQVYDADFIKFRSLSLTYNIPSKALRNKIAGLSVSLVGRNLFYLKRDTPNIDPEANYNNTNAQGLEYAGLPSVRSMGINLNVKF